METKDQEELLAAEYKCGGGWQRTGTSGDELLKRPGPGMGCRTIEEEEEEEEDVLPLLLLILSVASLISGVETGNKH